MSKLLKGDSQFSTHTVTDKDVYELVMNHSTFLDRLNLKKMVEMTLWAHTFLSDPNFKLKKAKWQFYGKNGFFTTGVIKVATEKS